MGIPLLSRQGARIWPEKMDYVGLWQYFENRGSELKGTMLQLVTLLLGFSAAILGYGVDKTLNFGASPMVTKPGLLVLIALVGLAIAAYAEIVIREFGEHINRNFDRADYSRLGDRPLDEILAYSERTLTVKRPLPRICRTVRRITRSFGAAFILLGCLALAAIE